MTDISIAVLGASGYTGAELVRLLLEHPHFRIQAMTADRKAGMSMADVFPQFVGEDLPGLVALADVNWDKIDAVFCALPHGTTQEVIRDLPGHLKIVDLSADFRLKEPALYAQWYGHEHQAVSLQAEAVYGLTELARDALAGARLVANPGCYPTCSQLPLVPLLEAGLIDPDNIVIDAKSGVSGAGRAAKEANLYTEVTEGLHPYGVASHRHAPEIEQGLGEAAGKPVIVSFTPHLIPMSRGMLCTTYVRLAKGATAEDLRACLIRRYADEPFLRILDKGKVPQTRFVRGSNMCHIAVAADRRPGCAILMSAIDNLVKGASGQALQNMNLLFGFPETCALTQRALFP